MHICDWDNFSSNLKILKHSIENNEKIIEPFPLLSLIDDMSLQKRILYFTAMWLFKKIGIIIVKI